MMRFPEPVTIIPALLLAGLIHPACADNWYQVEVLVFAHLKPDMDGEIWLQDPGRPAYANALALSDEDQTATVVDGREGSVSAKAEPANPDTDGPVPFVRLGRENFRLQGVYSILKRSPDYRPLQHISWQQPALKGRAARAVHLSLYRQLTSPAPLERSQIQKAEGPQAMGEAIFDGFIRIRSSRLLHMEVDINYFPEMPEKNKNDTQVLDDTGPTAARAVAYVRLKESRQIRLGDIHYFDHPLFGVIVQVSRLQSEVRQSGE